MGERGRPDLVARPKCNPVIGELPVLQYCAAEQLCVDERYQRSLEANQSIRLIRRIAANWDWGLCQPLYVARRSDGKLYVVDGQHRWAAAKLRGDVWQLPCVVRSFASTEEEAAAFVALNQERTPLTALQIFRAFDRQRRPRGMRHHQRDRGIRFVACDDDQQSALRERRHRQRRRAQELLARARQGRTRRFPGRPRQSLSRSSATLRWLDLPGYCRDCRAGSERPRIVDDNR
jgi:hypothetical protein